jgi:hypothetical protein
VRKSRRFGFLDRKALIPLQRTLRDNIYQILAVEVLMRDARVTALSFVLLLPALVLVASGLLGFERPDALVHPTLVLGGLLLAVTLNALLVFRVRLGHEEGGVVGSVFLRVRGAVLNLTALGLSCLLLAAIAAYLVVENFQPR